MLAVVRGMAVLVKVVALRWCLGSLCVYARRVHSAGTLHKSLPSAHATHARKTRRIQAQARLRRLMAQGTRCSGARGDHARRTCVPRKRARRRVILRLPGGVGCPRLGRRSAAAGAASWACSKARATCVGLLTLLERGLWCRGRWALRAGPKLQLHRAHRPCWRRPHYAPPRNGKPRVSAQGASGDASKTLLASGGSV